MMATVRAIDTIHHVVEKVIIYTILFIALLFQICYDEPDFTGFFGYLRTGALWGGAPVRDNILIYKDILKPHPSGEERSC